jgi:hypothetical protein
LGEAVRAAHWIVNVVRVWEASRFSVHDQFKRGQLLGWEAKIEGQLKGVVTRGDRRNRGGRNRD